MTCRRAHVTDCQNLANLDRVVNTRFIFVGFPLKLLTAARPERSRWSAELRQPPSGSSPAGRLTYLMYLAGLPATTV